MISHYIYISFLMFITGNTETIEQKVEGVEFLLHTRMNKDTPVLLAVNNITNYNLFNNTHITRIFIHGLFADKNHFMECKNAILEQQEENVIIVDWAKIALDVLYPLVVQQTVPVGEHIAKLIKNIIAFGGLEPSKLHLVGHSLGAHIAGIINNRLGNERSARITGLEPAKPEYEDGLVPLENMLDSSDADCVQIVHTFTALYGYSGTLGHGDFYPNGGRMQPGCALQDLITLGCCSHHRVTEFYEQWIKNPGVYIGTQCDSWEDYIAGKCNKNEKAIMLDDIEGSCAHGTYYLRTSAYPPYEQLT